MFLAEGREHLQELNLAVVRIEETPDDPDTVDEIFRIAHSMKGMSATMGFAGMAALTHEMEDVFELLRQRSGGLERAAIDVLFDSLDALSAAVEAIDQTGAGGDPAAGADRAPAEPRARAHADAGGPAGRRRAAPGQPDRAGRRPPRGPDHGDPQRGRLDAGRARLHGAVGDRRARRDARLPAVAGRGRHLRRPRDRRLGGLRAHRHRAGRRRRLRARGRRRARLRGRLRRRAGRGRARGGGRRPATPTPAPRRGSAGGRRDVPAAQPLPRPPTAAAPAKTITARAAAPRRSASTPSGSTS